MILLKFIIKVLLQLIGLPILAIALLFVPRHREQLPRFLRWFDNYHGYHFFSLLTWEARALADAKNCFISKTNPLGVWDGLSGDTPYREMKFGTFEKATSWLARFNWLAMRNAVNYFQFVVLGFKPLPGDEFKSNTDKIVSDQGQQAGLKINHILRNGKKVAWEVYWVWSYMNGRCIRLRLGYKLDSLPEFNYHIANKLHIQYVCAINPWKRYV